ncbi:hypothetical protein HY58_01260 [Flavihumibacter sp. ZG627]|nr:hypothetical protein HY58_01260 [Flavihumibacter sp. ZG627]
MAQADSNKTTITLAAIYSNNASYYGQTAAERMPYIATNASLRFGSGIYLNAMAYRLLNQNAGTAVSASSLGAGYGFNILPKLSADLNYTHSFYPSNSGFVQAANTDFIGAALSYEHLFTTGVSMDYAIGKQERNDMFLTLNNSRVINLGSLNKEKDLLTLTPSVDIVAGSRYFYESYIVEKARRDSLLGIPLLPAEPEQETMTKESSSFDIMSYSLKLPLAYNRSRYMIEAAYQLSVLGKKLESFSDERMNSFFSLSFYYQF